MKAQKFKPKKDQIEIISKPGNGLIGVGAGLIKIIIQGDNDRKNKKKAVHLVIK